MKILFWSIRFAVLFLLMPNLVHAATYEAGWDRLQFPNQTPIMRGNQSTGQQAYDDQEQIQGSELYESVFGNYLESVLALNWRGVTPLLPPVGMTAIENSRIFDLIVPANFLPNNLSVLAPAMPADYQQLVLQQQMQQQQAGSAFLSP